MGILDFLKKTISTTDNVDEKSCTNNNEKTNSNNKNCSLEYKKDEYEKDQSIVLCLKKYQISYDVYLEYKHKLSSNLTIRDIVWHIFNEQLKSYSTNKEFGLLRNVYYYMARFLEEEKKNADVLFNYIMCLYIDINLGNYQKMMLENINDKKFLLDCIDEDPLAPRIISKIKEYSNFCDEEIFERIFSNSILPFKFIADDEFKSMVNDIYTSDSFDEEKYISIVVENAKKIINKM